MQLLMCRKEGAGLLFRVRVGDQMDAVIISARVIAIYPPRMVWGGT